MLHLADVIEQLESWMPLSLAAEWDNVGLLLGDRSAKVERIMTCLTVTPESAGEAIERSADLIVSHHPTMFKAVRRLSDDTREGKMLWSLARSGIAIYSPHTALDNAVEGINAMLAAKLDLQEVLPLRAGNPDSKKFKVVVFVPDSDLSRVSEAMFSAGAGRIGEYQECSFRLSGTGTFHGSEESNPTIGERGRREEVNEWRLEVVCPESNLRRVLSAMREAHSYEEPAFDVYPLAPTPSSIGEGRFGTLTSQTTLENLAARVKCITRCGPVQIVGERGRSVSRIAIVCGSGGELLRDAIRARADVFLTGEARFHDYLEARAAGVAMILPGHYATERLGVEELAKRISKHWPSLDVWASDREADPVSWE